jgi:NDP-sugar pyrophosphorylase family protein
MIHVVLMAGGLGTRLHPLTLHAPKPLLNVGGKPILQTIVERFAAQGFRRFTMAVNYKRELIEGYFQNGTRFGVKIDYVRETEPLGTGGALRLIKPPTGPFIVANADVLTDLKYGPLMEFHARSNCQATLCLALHQYQCPYGVAEAQDERLVNVREKPIFSYPVNAGIYVLNPSALEIAPHGRFDMPDLIEKLRPDVAAFGIEDFWEDVGNFEALERARAGA